MSTMTRDRLMALGSLSWIALKLWAEHLTVEELDELVGDKAINGGEHAWPETIEEHDMALRMLQSPSEGVNLKDYLGITERLRQREIKKQADQKDQMEAVHNGGSEGAAAKPDSTHLTAGSEKNREADDVHVLARLLAALEYMIPIKPINQAYIYRNGTQQLTPEIRRQIKNLYEMISRLSDDGVEESPCNKAHIGDGGVENIETKEAEISDEGIETHRNDVHMSDEGVEESLPKEAEPRDEGVEEGRRNAPDVRVGGFGEIMDVTEVQFEDEDGREEERVRPEREAYEWAMAYFDQLPD